MLKWKKKWKIRESFRDGSLRLRYFIYLHPLSNSFTISRLYILSLFFLSLWETFKFRKKFCLLSVQRREISLSSGYGWIRVNNRKTRKRCKESLRNSISQVAALNVALSLLSPNVSLTSVCIRLYPFVLDILFHNSCYCSRIIATKLSC